MIPKMVEHLLAVKVQSRKQSRKAHHSRRQGAQTGALMLVAPVNFAKKTSTN